MYRCSECERLFEEPEYHEVCWEAEYGVASMFQSLNYGTVAECPYCGHPIDTYMDEVDEDEM